MDDHKHFPRVFQRQWMPPLVCKVETYFCLQTKCANDLQDVISTEPYSSVHHTAKV